MAAEFQPEIFAGRAMSEGNVVVGNVVEEVEFVFLEEEAGGNGVDGGITPSLVEEATVLVEGLEKVEVGFGPEPVEVADFKVGPLDNN